MVLWTVLSYCTGLPRGTCAAILIFILPPVPPLPDWGGRPLGAASVLGPASQTDTPG